MWQYLILLSTIFSAFSVIICKKGLKRVSPTFLFWGMVLFATPVYLIGLWKDGIPEVDGYFWIGIIGSVLFYSASYIINYSVLRETEVSSVYPLTAFRTLFTLIIAIFPPLKETPSVYGLFGVLLLIVGVYILKLEGGGKTILIPFKELLKKNSLLFLISTLLLSITIIFDKFAIMHTVDKGSSYTVLMENNLMVILFLIILMIKKENIVKLFRASIKYLLLLGILGGLSSLIAFTAIPEGKVGYISAIQNFQVVIVVIMGIFLLGEKKYKLQKITGSFLMCLGVVIITLLG